MRRMSTTKPLALAALLAGGILVLSCGGGSDEDAFTGDFVSLSATVNGEAASGRMSLTLVQDSVSPVSVRYEVVAFNLFGQRQLSGQGGVVAFLADRRITMSIDAVVAPPPVDVALSGEGIADSILPLRFRDLVLRGNGVEVVLSTE